MFKKFKRSLAKNDKSNQAAIIPLDNRNARERLEEIINSYQQKLSSYIGHLEEEISKEQPSQHRGNEENEDSARVPARKENNQSSKQIGSLLKDDSTDGRFNVQLGLKQKYEKLAIALCLQNELDN